MAVSLTGGERIAPPAAPDTDEPGRPGRVMPGPPAGYDPDLERVEIELLNRQYLQLAGTMDRDVWAKRGAKRKSRQVGPPDSTSASDSLSPLVSDEREPQATA